MTDRGMAAATTIRVLIGSRGRGVRQPWFWD
jgi:hypothetical protein